MVIEHIDREVKDADKLAALQAALESQTFARADRLKRMLRFLCEAEIEGRQSELTEYLIGVRALGRPETFSPLEDSYVRSRAHELRHKLEKFYSEEAPDSPFRIEVRKGSYVPRFSPHSPVVVQEAEPAKEPASRRIWPLVAAAAAGAGLVLISIAAWSSFALPGQALPGTNLARTVKNPLWTSAMETFWRPFIANNARLTVVFQNRFFVRMADVYVRDWRVDSPLSIESSSQLMQIRRLLGVERFQSSMNYADSGTPPAVFYLTRLLGDRVPSLNLRTSGELSAADMAGSNLILMGKASMDPQLANVLARQELVDLNGRIRNVHPLPGEKAEYADQHDIDNEDAWGEKYSVISVLPGRGAGGRVLALTGSGSEHPGALAFYVTDPAHVEELLKNMRLAPNESPGYFQVLVRMQFRSKNPITVDYVTHRKLRF